MKDTALNPHLTETLAKSKDALVVSQRRWRKLRVCAAA
jgi:hypothetical protein